MYNIGDNVEFNDEFGERKTGRISEVLSDMDSYENMKVENDVVQYWSKKLKKFVPVKPKNMATVFFAVKTSDSFIEFVTPKEIL